MIRPLLVDCATTPKTLSSHINALEPQAAAPPAERLTIILVTKSWNDLLPRPPIAPRHTTSHITAASYPPSIALQGHLDPTRTNSIKQLPLGPLLPFFPE